MRMARVGGGLCLAVSVALFVRILAVDRLEATAVGVLALAALAGLLAVLRPGSVGALMAADVILVIALFPAVFGWVPLLYVPSLALMVAATIRAVRDQDRA